MDENELSVLFEPWLKVQSWMSDHDLDDARFHKALFEAVKGGHMDTDNSVHENAFLIALRRLESREPSKFEKEHAHEYGLRASSIMHFLKDLDMLHPKES